MFKVYGINQKTSQLFKRKYGLNSKINNFESINSKLKLLFNNYIKDKKINRNLFDFNKSNINFLKNIKSYRGVRHRNKYPVRGQRTHTNATKKNFKFPKI